MVGHTKQQLGTLPKWGSEMCRSIFKIDSKICSPRQKGSIGLYSYKPFFYFLLHPPVRSTFLIANYFITLHKHRHLQTAPFVSSAHTFPNNCSNSLWYSLALEPASHTSDMLEREFPGILEAFWLSNISEICTLWVPLPSNMIPICHQDTQNTLNLENSSFLEVHLIHSINSLFLKSTVTAVQNAMCFRKTFPYKNNNNNNNAQRSITHMSLIFSSS